jgi:hypothetical protein
VLTPGEFGARIAEWVALVNAGSLDLPADLLHRQATFRLNGVAYEDRMGRPVTDPLVRLMARGQGGYRLLLTALRYALTAPEVALRDLVAARGLATAHADLSGVLRDTGETWTGVCDLVLVLDVDGRITEIGIQMDPDAVSRIQRARSAPEPP